MKKINFFNIKDQRRQAVPLLEPDLGYNSDSEPQQSESDSIEEKPMSTGARRNRFHWSSMVAWTIVTILLAVNLGLLLVIIVRTQPVGENLYFYSGYPLLYSVLYIMLLISKEIGPAAGIADTKLITFNTSLYIKNQYNGGRSPEIDKAWNQLEYEGEQLRNPFPIHYLSDFLIHLYRLQYDNER